MPPLRATGTSCVPNRAIHDGAGLPSVRDPRFEVDAHWVKCFVSMRPDWPGNLSAGE